MRLLPLAPLALLAACSSAGQAPSAVSTGSRPSATPAATPSGPELRVSGYRFPALAVAPGARISLVDLDDEPHTVTATDGSFSSRSFDRTTPGTLLAPPKPGSYAFTCTVHPTMHGTLVVR